MDNKIVDLFEVVLYTLACPFVTPLIIQMQEDNKDKNNIN